MTTSLIQPPATTPVSLTQAKTHLRCETSAEDDYILDLISTATVFVEQTISRKLITQTWRQYVEKIGCERTIVLEVRPPQSIVEVTAYDEAGTPTVLNVQDYSLNQYTSPPTVTLNVTASTAMIELDVVAGFGDTGADVPGTLLRAILVLVGHWYEFRGAIDVAEQPASIPAGFQSLLAPYMEPKL